MEVSEQVNPVNVEAAQRMIDETTDPVMANVMRFVLAQAQLLLVPTVGRDAEEWKRDLPAAPFDMAFLLRIVRAVVERRQVLEALLAGKSTAEASGWEFP